MAWKKQKPAANKQTEQSNTNGKTKPKPNKKNRGLSSWAPIVVILIGIAMILYPTVSDRLNRRVQMNAVAQYGEVIELVDKEALWNGADSYNQELLTLPHPFVNYTSLTDYDSILDADDSGMMGWITIEKINVHLAFYHGNSKEVLDRAAGHLPGSSFPVGGDSTHAVLMAHRGLPSAELFTHLDKLELGDVFTLHILDEELTYEVDHIYTVQPSELEYLYIREGKDLVTLVTCTPYGINTDRLLVQGHRIETPEVEEQVPFEAAYGKLIWTIVGTLFGILLLGILLARKLRRAGKGNNKPPESSTGI